MNRRLIIWEMRKLWSCPMISIFLVLCMAFNFLLILSFRYNWDYVHYVAQVTEQVGDKLGPYFDQAVKKLPNTEYKEPLIAQTKGAIDILETYDAQQIGDLCISKFHISGLPAQLLERKYEKLQKSVNRLEEQDASLSLCAAGATKSFFDSLYRVLCRGIITEGIILAVLMALYSCGCEAISKTSLNVYSTRTGRQIQKSKAAASALSAVGAYGILVVVSVLFFACMWRPGSIWSSNISSQFNYLSVIGLKQPFITWTSFSVAGYLAATILLGAVTVVIFHGLGFAAGLVTGDAYKGFLLFLLGGALLFEGFILAGDNGQWGIYQFLQWTPVALWWFQPLWFTDMGIGAILPWQECGTAAICMIFSGVLLVLANLHFRKKDVT